MKAISALLLTFLLLATGCSATQQVVTTTSVQCPEAYNGCYAD